MIRAVLFDFYYTTFIPEYPEDRATDIFLKRTTEYLNKKGYDISYDSARSSFYDTICLFERLRRVNLFDAPVDHLIRSFAFRLGGYDDSLLSDILRIYTNALVESVRPDEDLEFVLSSLKDRRILVGIVSNAHQIYFIEESFKRYNLDRYVDRFFVSAQFGIRKPHPQIFRYATKILGIQPKNAIMVGDDFNSDFYGALRAGLIPVLIIREKTPLEIKNVLNRKNYIERLRDLIWLIDEYYS